jgi:Fe2+ transport system protein FeoA
MIFKLMKSSGNSVVVRVGDARVCLAADIARKIHVDLTPWIAD